MNNIWAARGHFGQHTGIRANTRVRPYGNTLNITTVGAHPRVCPKNARQ